jgi:uncharacterized protein (UPF0248 family)
MVNPRNILNELKWKQGFNLEQAEIWYVHRGAPNDTKIIQGQDIIKLEKSFIKTKSAMIPYHRIFKIVYDDKVLFER